jgi:hypothetical protein
MDHPCYKCGHSIEDGKPFCLQCGAPQIRVAMPEVAERSAEENISSNNASPFSPDSSVVASTTLSTGIQWPRALRVCAVAALISLVVMSLRLMVPLLAFLGAGCLAVILYRSRNPIWKANARTGAQLGAVTALFSSSIAALFYTILLTALQAGGQFRQQLLDSLQQAVARSNDPQMQASLDFLKNPEGLANRLIILFVVSVAAGSIAGALTGAFIGRRNRR